MGSLRRSMVLVAAMLLLTACGSDEGTGPLFGTDASGATITTGSSDDTTATTAADVDLRDAVVEVRRDPG